MHKSSNYCLNCNHKLTGNFCVYCGQAAGTERINGRHLAEELQHGLLHIDKGLLYTLKELFIRPGKTIHNYLDGKRVRYTRPFLFLLICGALYSLLFHFFGYFPMEKMNSHNSVIFDYIPLYHWYSSNYSLTVLLLLPFYALVTFVVFRRERYNYIEHLVVFSYLSGSRISFLILCYPLIYATASHNIYLIVNLIGELLLIRGLTLFFYTRSWVRIIANVLLSLILAIIGMLVLIFVFYEVLKYYQIRL